jgi:hypothetical protein
MAILEGILGGAGQIEQWRRLERFTAHVSVDGTLLSRKGWAGGLKEVVAEGSTRTQSIRFTGFTAPDMRGQYRPDFASIETLDGGLIRARENPLRALRAHADSFLWDELDLLSFCAAKVWHCLTLPFVLADPGVTLEELPVWRERGETWRRLRAVLPPDVAACAPEQIFYFDQAGLQRRMDYRPIDLCGAWIANFCSAHQPFTGIMLPTLHRSLAIAPDGKICPKPAVVDVEVFDVWFE